jgi:hypothetical protein
MELVLHEVMQVMQGVLVYCRRIRGRQGVADDNVWHEQDLEILGWEKDHSRGLQRIQEIVPDIVIIVRRELLDIPTSLVADIQKRYQRICVIEVNLGSDHVCVYGDGKQLAPEVRDLLADIVELPTF